VTRTTTHTTTTIRLLLAMTATLALALGLAFASPAAAQFVDESEDDGATEEQAADQEAADDEPTVEDEGSAGDEAPASNGNGFVGNNHDEHEAAPVGGIDAGFGGGAEQAGFGASHAAAMALLVLALTGHAANARRTSSVRA
jgi:hypothetical protein